MKQILQNLGSGATEVAEVPCPQARAGHLLIRTSRTLVSAGTERMLVEFGRGNLIQKAKSQPDKVKDVLSKIKTDGLMPTLDAVKAKLDVPMPLGYCNAGTVLEVGRGVEGFAVGDRVVSNGNHAEVVAVPKNLCARIPEGVTDEEVGRVKNRRRTSLVVEAESPYHRLTQLADDVDVFGRPRTVAERMEAVESLTRERIAEYLERWPITRDGLMVSVGPRRWPEA